MPQCPTCRGDLINNVGTGKWTVIFSMTTSNASGLDTATFELDAVLDDNSSVHKALSDISGVVVGDRTEFTWTLASPGSPISGTLSVDHDPLGALNQALTITEQSAAA